MKALRCKPQRRKWSTIQYHIARQNLNEKRPLEFIARRSWVTLVGGTSEGGGGRSPIAEIWRIYRIYLLANRLDIWGEMNSHLTFTFKNREKSYYSSGLPLHSRHKKCGKLKNLILPKLLQLERQKIKILYSGHPNSYNRECTYEAGRDASAKGVPLWNSRKMIFAVSQTYIQIPNFQYLGL